MVTLQQLRYFRELGATEQLTNTAEKLFISQTTLSNTIINLEKQLGIQLFDRVGRSIRLNEVGRQYWAYVNEALITLQNAQTIIDEYTGRTKSKVSVAMSSSHTWANMIRDFHLQYSDYNIRQVDCDCASFRNLLVNQDVDFVIAGDKDFSFSGLKCQLIQTNRLFLCVPRNHPLVDRHSVYFEDFKNENFISLPKTFGFRQFCDGLFRQIGTECQSTIECDYTLRGKLIEAGFGVAITTQISRDQNLFGDDIVYLPIMDEFARRPVAIIWNPKHHFSRAALDFKKYILQRSALSKDT